MMRHLIWFVLALSLLFNLFFAAGFVQARARQAEAADGVSSLVAKELNLDETQSEVFSRLHSAELFEGPEGARGSFTWGGRPGDGPWPVRLARLLTHRSGP